MHRLKSPVAVLAAVSLVAACAVTPRGPQAAEYRGRYTAGFEVSRFVSCDAPISDSPWWVVLSETALRQRDSVAAQLPDDAPAEAFVRWRGTASSSQPAGHLGRSTRYLHVHEILELRPVEPGDCGASGNALRLVMPQDTADGSAPRLE